MANELDTNAFYDQLRRMGVDPTAFLQQYGVQPVAPQPQAASAFADPETTGAITPPAQQPTPVTPPTFVGMEATGSIPNLPTRALGATQTAPASVPAPEAVAPAPTPAPVETPVPTAAPAAPAQPAPQEGGGFLGMNSMGDFGRRLERAAAWIAPPGNAQAALGFRNSDDNLEQNKISNARQDQELALKKDALAFNKMKATAPDVSISKSENGKFNVISRTNPLTGEVSFERKAIPADEQEKAETTYRKPPASIDKLLNDEESASVKNVEMLREGLALREAFRNNQVDMNLVGKTEAELKTLADSNDPRAQNAMMMKRYIQGVINNTLRNEKGVQTDSDAKRIASEILSGSSSYNNTQVYDWLGSYMGKLNTDTTVRSGRTQSRIKSFGPTFDPDDYQKNTFGAYGESAKNYYDSDQKAHGERPYRGGGSSAAPTSNGRVTSPLLDGLNRRFGTPGGR